jgi:hypothetical protein
VDELISAQQESGKLVTGLRRWRMRQSISMEGHGEREWTCPQVCGQSYRASSTRRIEQHGAKCRHRTYTEASEGMSAVEASVSSFSPAVILGWPQARGMDMSMQLDHDALAIGRIPGQFDGFEEDHPRVYESDVAVSREASNPTCDDGREATPLRRLLDRQRVESDHLVAQHTAQIVALCEGGSGGQSFHSPFQG